MFTKQRKILLAVVMGVVICITGLYSCAPNMGIGDGKVSPLEAKSFQLGVAGLFAVEPALVSPVSKIVNEVVLTMAAPDYVPGKTALIIIEEAVVKSGIPEAEVAIAMDFFNTLTGMIAAKIGNIGTVTPEQKEEVVRILFGLVKTSCDARLEVR